MITQYLYFTISTSLFFLAVMFNNISHGLNGHAIVAGSLSAMLGFAFAVLFILNFDKEENQK